MIIENNGKYRSERTNEELKKILEEEIANFTPDEREVLMLALQELDDNAVRSVNDSISGGGPARLIDTLSEAEYLRPMVDMETFVKDPYYLGNTCDNLYPQLLKDVTELFDGGYREFIVTGAIGIGKCVSGDTVIYDVESGKRRRADEIGALNVASVTEDGKIVKKSAECFYSGKKECLSVKLKNGSSITLSADHKVLTSDGWVESALLGSGVLVATPRSLPAPSKQLDISDDEVKLLAYLMGDGGCTGNTTFTNANQSIVDEFESLVLSVGDVSKYRPCQQYIKPGISPTKWQNSGKATSYSARGIRWLINDYACDARAKDKQLPPEMWGLSDRQVALFINRFISCDGHLNIKLRRIEICLASEKLIDDLIHLFLRLGVRTRKRYKLSSIKMGDGSKHVYDSWVIMVSDVDNVINCLEKIGEIKGKEDESQRLIQACLQVARPSSNVDIVPIGHDQLRECRNEVKCSGRSLGKPDGLRWQCPSGQMLSRSKFEQFVKYTKYSGIHAKHASSDVVWVEVDRVEPVGLTDVYDLTVPGTHNFIGNNIVLHNTFVGSVALCRILYEMSCLRDIHRSYGIAKDTNISLVALSVNEDLAVKVIFENVATKIQQSPYFQEHFPFEPTKKEMRFPHNIEVAARATTDTAVLGLNVISFIIDESNFLEGEKRGKASIAKYGNKDKVQHLYDQMLRRMKSRFMRHGRMPGMAILLSSKRTKDDFTQRRIDESRTDPTVFIRDYSTYELNPDRFSKKKFTVLVGNETTPSRILADEEVEPIRSAIAKVANKDLLLVEVPEDYRSEFEADVDKSLRDVAGISTVSISPFIHQRDKIELCIDNPEFPARKHPFDVVSWDQSKGGGFIWDRLAHRVQIRDGAATFEGWRPKFFPEYTRHFHIDSSLVDDCTGVCMGCVIGFKQTQRVNPDGEKTWETAPVIWIDLLLEVVPPSGGEIDQAKLRGLIYQMQDHGFPVGYGSMDQWNSASPLQLFKTKGIETEVMSVDKPIDAYETLRTAIYEGRVIMYRYEPVLDQLRKLQHDRVKSKVDHPKNGKKDVADALAAVVYSLTMKPSHAPLMIMKGVINHSDPLVEQDIKATEEDDNIFMMPFLMG